MTDLGDTMHKLRLTQEGEPINATITDIHAFGNFSSSWIGHDFLYEIPTLFITCETPLGEIQLESHIKNISDSGLVNILKNNSSFDATKNVDLESLIGETIYVAPDEETFHATIGWNTETRFSEDNKLVVHTSNLKHLDDFEVDSRHETGYEPHPTEWIETIIKTEWNRHISNTYGWIEVPFEYAGETEEHQFFKATIYDQTAYWIFEDSIEGFKTIETFLKNIGINYTPKEFDTETIWVKPLRDMHHTNRPEENEMYKVDAEEFWVAAKNPLSPAQNKSFFTQLKEFFTPNTGGVTVSATKSRSRRAKSSQTKSIPTPPKSQEGTEVEFEMN